MHEGIASWCDCCSCEAEPYWAAVALHGTSTEGAPIEKTLFAWGMMLLFSLIDLFIEPERRPHTVLARDIQRDVLTSRLRHVDFYQVQLDRKVRTSPALEIVGEAPATRYGDAILVQILNHIEVECLPGDLIDSIPVDVSSLETVNDSITVADLPVPPGITLLAEPTEVVVQVVLPRAAVEAEAEAAGEEQQGEEE